MPDTLGVIPARSGSKGLPGKNVKPLDNKPLIAWSIKQAAASEMLDHCIVSTDSEEYASVAREYGGSVPFIRPAEYATDDAPTSDVLYHALEYFRDEGRDFEAIALLEPTSPLRKPGDIDEALKTFWENDEADSLVTVGEVHLEHPHITKFIDDEGHVRPLIEHDDEIYRRQQLPDAYFPYGVLYVSTVAAFEETGTFYQDPTAHYELERWQNYEIDDIYDFICIERIVEEVGGKVEGYR